MSKATILDRLAGAMKTLGKREGKALTPKQRVAAAQRWNRLADISDNYLDWVESIGDRKGNYSKYMNALDDVEEMGLFESKHGVRPDNPFRLDWMGEPYQYEARLRNYRPLTDAQYERMLEREEEARLRGFDPYSDDFDYMWRY